MKSIAIVTPWFGKELTGGAEQTAWQLANRLSARGHPVEVLTTCCKSFLENWAKNHHRSGVKKENGFVIRRFPVDKRNQALFDQINGHLLSLPSHKLKPGLRPVHSGLSKIFVNENINSSALLDFLKRRNKDYHSFVFIPYLYGPIIKGLPIVADRAYLLPCLHDEAYAYLNEVGNIFYKAKNILFNSEGEMALAQSLYGPGITLKSEITGLGIEIDNKLSVSMDCIQSIKLSDKRFILYLGRRDSTKNVEFLVEVFIRYKQQNPETKLMFVLAGPGKTSFHRSEANVIDLGLVKADEKNALLANCLALVQPSKHESYSRVIMEAWFHGKPAVAHQACLATANIVGKSNGGWLAETQQEWIQIVSHIDALDVDTLNEKGNNGKHFAGEYAVWDRVIDHYEKILKPPEPEINRSIVGKKLKEIHQILPTLAYGDAISNQGIAIRDYLRGSGFSSDIYAEHIDDQMAHEGTPFRKRSISKHAGVLYHHSIGSELTEFAIDHPGPKCLVYHNITPDRFYVSYRKDFAEILRKGREDLNRLAAYFRLSVGDSSFNILELQRAGFQQPSVLPIIVSPEKWIHDVNGNLMNNLQDHVTNLLFVGRISPNKCQHDLIKGFYEYIRLDSVVRLILVGYIEQNDPYYEFLRDTIRNHGLDQHVILTGNVSESDLQAYYQTAHLIWSMSEHEGFCVPLIEAMWFDVPVLAFKSTAVPETLKTAGILFKSKEDLKAVAALAKLMVHDKPLRKMVIEAQRKRRSDFLPERIWPLLSELISRIESYQT